MQFCEQAVLCLHKEWLKRWLQGRLKKALKERLEEGPLLLAHHLLLVPQQLEGCHGSSRHSTKLLKEGTKGASPARTHKHTNSVTQTHVHVSGSFPFS